LDVPASTIERGNETSGSTRRLREEKPQEKGPFESKKHGPPFTEAGKKLEIPRRAAIGESPMPLSGIPLFV
jgi:hypothetical protein